MSTVWRVLLLPVLEPMTRARLSRIVVVAMSCLQAALTAAVATSVASMAGGVAGGGGGPTGGRGASTSGGSKEEEVDGYAGVIVHKAVSRSIISCLTASF